MYDIFFLRFIDFRCENPHQIGVIFKCKLISDISVKYGSLWWTQEIIEEEKGIGNFKT